ncbi:hypothetical protein O0I10_000484 [Lichtheimia ornata]|uniref:Protein kinase domain-containing protein n=1 Tax=Lichtheimia ornata TaxID=688661 RepID=A0AAD7Y3T6_9FUNG|nr:uncharacterized protein O0I10_000484 [Lichtheimia ornata]KAJ8663246.1 hypothetical protein O0I10_000484 [Lichtheimia ornata]
MPRFSLGSYLPATSRQQHVQQEEQQQQQQPDTLKGWWTKLVDKFTTERDDFGDLSPDRPPLPFIASLGDAGTGSNIGRNLPPQASSSSSAPENSSGINRFTRAKRIAPQAEVAPVTHRLSADERAFRGALYTIIEESETILSLSSQTMTRPRPLSSSLDDDKLKRISITSNGTNASGDSSGSSTSSSSASYHPPPLWPSQPQKREPHFRHHVIGDETKCRRKFIKMVQSAKKFHNEYKGVIPKEMQVVFNAYDNVQCIRLEVDGKIEDHKFCGNSQFIPPELSTHGTFHNSRVDVWVLGVNLYRMLVGRYPFVANNDRKLFKKMLSADFSLPQDCSEDAKDLLRRMLAPDTTRASLDLVLHHPWVNPFKVAVPPTATSSEEEDTSSASRDPTPPSTIEQRLPTTQQQPEPSLMTTDQEGSAAVQPQPSISIVVENESPSSSTEKPKKQRSRRRPLRKAMHVIKRATLFVVQGPYPPPSRPYHEFGRPLQAS